MTDYPIIYLTEKEAYTKTAKEIFTINGVLITLGDFGEVTCNFNQNGIPVLTPKPPSEEILEKYQLTEPDYWKIAEALKEKMYWGMTFPCCRPPVIDPEFEPVGSNSNFK